MLQSSGPQAEDVRHTLGCTYESPNQEKEYYLTWNNVSYTIGKSRETSILRKVFGQRDSSITRLLHGVSGIAIAGKLMAILGPSGSGKTILLAAISGRAKGQATGDTLLNGEAIDPEQMKRISGFVPQVDLVIDCLTVQEHMEFMARMKMDRRERSVSRKQRIAILLAELGLDRCCNSKLSSLSGGERKRLALAVELLTEPKILFCDEPTTGLDSYAAVNVVTTLRALASSGKIVVCSMHQPASGLLDICHEVLLLAAGKVAFQGTSDQATTFFDSLGLCCPPTYNNAEFYVSHLSLVRGKEAESYAKINWICDQFKKSKYSERVSGMMTKSCAMGQSVSYTGLSLFSSDDSSETKATRITGGWKRRKTDSQDFWKVRLITQVRWLTWRTYVDHKRNMFSHLLRFATYMFVGLLISSPYVGIVSEALDQEGIQSMQGLMYLVVVETVFTFNYAVFYTFPRELPLLLRDIAAGLYSPAPYYISKIAILIPGAIVQPFLYTLFIFTITGLSGGPLGFAYFVLPVILAAISASALGCFLSASFESIDTASLFSVPLDFLTLIFCGIYLHLDYLNPGIGWLKYLSQFYFGLEAVSLTQWLQVDHIDCSSDPEAPCISSGLGVLDKYGYRPDHYAIDLLGLMVIGLVSHCAGFLIIRYRSRKEPVY